MAAPGYFGVADLAARWRYTRQGIHKLIRRPDFPPPVFTINLDRVKIWARADIEFYERDRPELGNETAKRQKIVGGYLGNRDRDQPVDPGR
jgi:hypothetical protein